jgi:hypothetical protein
MRIWHSGPEIGKNLEKLITFVLYAYFSNPIQYCEKKVFLYIFNSISYYVDDLFFFAKVIFVPNFGRF